MASCSLMQTDLPLILRCTRADIRGLYSRRMIVPSPTPKVSNCLRAFKFKRTAVTTAFSPIFKPVSCKPEKFGSKLIYYLD